MGGYLSFDVAAKDLEDELIMNLMKLQIEKVTEFLDYVKEQYSGVFLLTKGEFEEVHCFFKI